MNETNEPTLDDVADAFKESLDRMGSLDPIRANLRAKVFECLQLSLRYSNDDQGVVKNTIDSSSRHHHHELQMKNLQEIQLIDELIMEYFKYVGYHYTLSTFVAESAHNKDSTRTGSFSRDFDEINEKLNCDEDEVLNEGIEYENRNKLPTLYRLIRWMKRSLFM